MAFAETVYVYIYVCMDIPTEIVRLLLKFHSYTILASHNLGKQEG